MISHGLEEKHWLHVAVRFITDVAIVFGSFMLALRIRFADEWLEKTATHWFAFPIGGLFLASVIYILGYYSRPMREPKPIFQGMVLFIISVVMSFLILILPYAFMIRPLLGRGAMSIGFGLSFFFVYMHHLFINHWRGSHRIRVAVIVGSKTDEREARALYHDCSQFVEVTGVVSYMKYEVKGKLRELGSALEIDKIVEKAKLERVLCTNRSMTETALFQKFCQLRYMGIVVMPLIGVYEEFHQFCPTDFVTPEWLLQASTSPQMLYIRKMKRGFDIAASLLGLVFLGPILLFAILLQKIFEGGPAFYRQKRLGRFGREFTVIKLRTMIEDAEKGGAEWAKANDSRITFLGGIYRKYRIDEIPQLFNVLRGEMSFVGPRPERPEFTEQLSQEIPFFLERLLIQPGITGWAQVSYPYGANTEDARRKLEYDLYYIKHMSLFFDLFILLDTVRTILLGGSIKPEDFAVDYGQKKKAEQKEAK